MNPELAARFASIGRPRILVVGDLMLDRYVWGSVDRVSPEAPIPVLKVTEQEDRPGGAFRVAAALAALDAKVECAGVIGDDADGAALMRLLDEFGVDAKAVLRLPGRPTTVKTRMVARVQQLFRVDREVADAIPESAQARLLKRVGAALKRADAVLVPDYNKGVLTPPFLHALIRAAKAAGRPLIVDPARGVDPTRYKGATAICPNRFEAALAAGLPNEAPLVDKIAVAPLRRLGLDACVITRDREGMSLYRKGEKPYHVKARAHEVFDVTGAGDVVLSLLGFVLAGGGDFEDAVAIANVAGGIEVAKFGFVPLTRHEIQAELEVAAYAETKLRSRGELATIVKKLKSQGKTVVFTNGCFDLLNANHISLLRHSKSLGDVLIVATNSDESIRRLKGPSRPILSEAERVELLSAVHHVDYVTVFPEDTPRPLLQLLQPDILVKGGDYKRKEEVVGWEIVESYGGRIARAPMSNYHSTSRIVEKVLNSHGRSRT
ncbi:MAG: bifunctional heptose 7-phosphate kinase/heptose 1-phosphate adenyltransferase [Planctomycetes bacterium]|nr:bifunctional heptose 7-phosphate kinase/heptose 1-phosphate adenyltransferase [Planctomycetota bacterium]